MAACDGCGREDLAIAEYDGLQLCAACAERRADDPPVEVQGRMLLTSEAAEQGVLPEEPTDDADAKPARRPR